MLFSMNVGDLVITKQRWGLDSQRLGIIVERTSTGDDTWLILWSTKMSYKLKEHIGEALIIIESLEKE